MQDPSLRGEWFGVEHLPQGRLRVRVWPGIEAVTDGVTDTRGRVRWYEVRGRDLKPIQGPVAAWQPMTQGWRWPRRQPMPLPTSALAGLEAHATALATLDAAALAAEMERDREDAGQRQRLPPPEPLPQWWRDGSRITYEARGAVSVKHGEGRLMRALATDRAVRVGMQPLKSSMAALAPLEILSEILSADPPEPMPHDWVPHVQPLPQDWSDYLTAMAWVVEASPPRRSMRILRARARTPAVSWLAIGDALGIHWTRAQQIYAATVAQVVDAANRRPRRAAARLRVVQAQNRQAKR